MRQKGGLFIPYGMRHDLVCLVHVILYRALWKDIEQFYRARLEDSRLPGTDNGRRVV